MEAHTWLAGIYTCFANCLKINNTFVTPTKWLLKFIHISIFFEFVYGFSILFFRFMAEMHRYECIIYRRIHRINESIIQMFKTIILTHKTHRLCRFSMNFSNVTSSNRTKSWTPTSVCCAILVVQRILFFFYFYLCAFRLCFDEIVILLSLLRCYWNSLILVFFVD